MSWFALSNSLKYHWQTIPQSADTPSAMQNLVFNFCNKFLARTRWLLSWRSSEAMYASSVATGSSIRAIFPTGPAVESKRCLANAKLCITLSNGRTSGCTDGTAARIMFSF